MNTYLESLVLICLFQKFYGQADFEKKIKTDINFTVIYN